MPTIDENRSAWGGYYNWANRGDEWSSGWGGSFMQWYGSILPRIKAHVPTRTVLEIACGYGRWTQYLKDLCDHLFVVDLSENCITNCKERFSDVSNIDYYVNDGKSLHMIQDKSCDFVFSFDSLVHADESVIGAYICELKRILAADGVAFLHHSNLGAYCPKYLFARRSPKFRRIVTKIRTMEKSMHWRDHTVEARTVEVLARKHGLNCVSQELVRWGTKRAYIDCFSTIRAAARSPGHNIVLRNPHFMNERRNLFALSKLYAP